MELYSSNQVHSIMSKALYCYKIWLFRDQFKLTKEQEVGIRDICLFCSLVYVRSWMTCSLPTKAPRQDLHLMKQLIVYKWISPAISKATSEKFSNHMWYLSEEMVALAFFDKCVTLSTKRKMVNSLEKEHTKVPLRDTKFDFSESEQRELGDFVSKKTLQFFKKLNLSHQFLSIDPVSWADRDDY